MRLLHTSDWHLGRSFHRESLLEAQGVGADVVSMPSWERFETQELQYKRDVLPPHALKVSIEAGTTLGPGP